MSDGGEWWARKPVRTRVLIIAFAGIAAIILIASTLVFIFPELQYE